LFVCLLVLLQRLKEGKYEAWVTFETDMKLIWSNGLNNSCFFFLRSFFELFFFWINPKR